MELTMTFTQMQRMEAMNQTSSGATVIPPSVISAPEGRHVFEGSRKEHLPNGFTVESGYCTTCRMVHSNVLLDGMPVTYPEVPRDAFLLAERHENQCREEWHAMVAHS